jgi:tetratricopeptide (TPR) repeat protein
MVALHGQMGQMGQTPLIGRRQELAIILERLEAGIAGQGGAVVIRGEAGIGKSRLVAEARARAEQQDIRYLGGACFQGDRALPYAPFLDLLRAAVAGAAGARLEELLGVSAPEIVSLLPELAARLPAVVPATADEPEQHKRRLFHALSQFIGQLARRRPLLLVLEDLHWADDTSLELVPLLVRELAGQAVVVLLTYRSDEIGAPLAQMLGELNRHRLAIELPLAQLGMGEVEALLRVLLGQDQPIRAELFEQVYGLTEGNPYFVEEVARSLSEERGGVEPVSTAELPVPRTVADAVRARAAHLSGAAREVLTLAAVAGRRFDLALVQELAGLDTAVLVRLIKELVAAQLVNEESADRFAFRHALTREAIYASLLGLERRALHARVLAAVERRAAGAAATDAAALSYHAAEAGQWDRVLRYAEQAGERAWALHAPRAAVEHFTRAIEAAERLRVPPAAAVVLTRGRAYRLLGEFARARDDFERAAQLAHDAGDPQAEWQALLDLGFLWASRDYAQAGACFQAALALAREIGDPALLAQSLNRLGNWHGNVEQPQAALALHQEASALFRARDDAHGVADTLDLLGITSIFLGDLPGAAAYLDEALAGLRARDDREGLATTLVMRMATGPNYEMVTVVPARDDPPALLDVGLEALALARGIGQRSREAFALFGLAMNWGVLGRYAEALPAARQAIAIAEEIGHAQWLSGAHFALGNLLLDLLAPVEARPLLARALALARDTGSVNWIRLSAAYLAMACLRAGDPSEAAALLDEVLDADGPLETISQRLVWLARAELALARGAPGRAVRIAEGLLASAPRRTLDDEFPQLAWLRGEALARLGRHDDAGAAIEAAAVGAAALGLRPLQWRIDAARGRLAATLGRRGAATAAFAAARTTIEQLAANVPAEPLPLIGAGSLREHYLEAALATLPRLRAHRRPGRPRNAPTAG